MHANGDETARGDRVRLIDVATNCGVTKSVVSRVLNNDPTINVRPATRQRILETAAELGYRPHAGARALAGAEARALALLIPDLTNPVYSRIIRGAYREARRHGYVVLLAEDTTDDQAGEVFTELVETGRVDGLLIASARPAHPLIGSPRLAHIPHVFVNREVAGSGRNVGMDLASASATAVRHLHQLGHRVIGMVSGPMDLEPARARRTGFVHQMRELGLNPHLIEDGPFNELGGAEASTRLLRAHPDVTAVYASTLSQAVGAMHAVRRAGLQMPADLSIIAYDDLPLADYLDPPLTTIGMPLNELGAAAVNAILDQLAGHAPSDCIVATQPVVIERASTAQPPNCR
ncbi:LacI family DNA-binding transcriptional regulator [Mycolicibacterium sp. YH-1]|uniref:LacI family DNA-binding transcriptional regulator n=1 Tax=Mycolicibacterium sp. YH-1 TaxID=2908837 RepID=UPI001F4BEA99|nr:LacI family DNA-binding transcriptional regulator [Mycolicibacterium sp. YH-1]UNB54446.1 LacI family transcriptional regulator [Mycolicibacterium sp. YH-1]